MVPLSTTAAGTAGSTSHVNLPSGVKLIIWTITLLACGLLLAGYRWRTPALANPDARPGVSCHARMRRRRFVVPSLRHSLGNVHGHGHSQIGRPELQYAVTVTVH